MQSSNKSWLMYSTAAAKTLLRSEHVIILFRRDVIILLKVSGEISRFGFFWVSFSVLRAPRFFARFTPRGYPFRCCCVFAEVFDFLLNLTPSAYHSFKFSVHFHPLWGAGHSWACYNLKLVEGQGLRVTVSRAFEFPLYHGICISASTVFDQFLATYY